MNQQINRLCIGKAAPRPTGRGPHSRLISMPLWALPRLESQPQGKLELPGRGPEVHLIVEQVKAELEGMASPTVDDVVSQLEGIDDPPVAGSAVQGAARFNRRPRSSAGLHAPALRALWCYDDL